MEISIRTSSGYVSVKTGREGPRHDPYSYTEYTVKRGAGTTVLHGGLGEWVKYNDVEIETSKPERVFEILTGTTVKVIENAINRRRTRCPDCWSRRIEASDGYPGETLYICGDCRMVVTADFNESAVI